MHPDRMIPQVEDINIDFMEANLRKCPFCSGNPFFEETSKGWYVACECGVRMPGDTAQNAAEKWCFGRRNEAWTGW